MEATCITQLLKGFCDDTKWKYAVFWKLNHHFPMILTYENGYYCYKKTNEVVESSSKDDSVDYSCRFLMAEMSRLKYSFGEGVVGKIALSGDHCWCPDEWLLQFANGIKTIVLLPVLPQGVLQFGSFEAIVEDLRFINNVKDKFHPFYYLPPNTEPLNIGINIQEDWSILAATNTIMDSLDESSSITNSLLKDEVSGSTTLYVNESTWWNATMPSFIQDECYMSRENELSSLKRASENEMKTNDVEEEIWGNNVGLFGETSNGLGSYSGMSMTQQQFAGTETGHNDVENWNDFFTFPPESDPEYRFDDVLSNLYSVSDDTSSISNSVRSPITMPIDFTGSIQPNINSEESTLIVQNSYIRSNLMPNHFTSPSFDGNSSLLIDEAEGEKVYRHMKPVSGAKLSSKSKKKAKVGNSQRSRPRDRQMIMDRMKELRELVPDGGRCSIDNLLEQTINHMLYLRKVTSQAEKLKRFAHREVQKCKKQKTKDSYLERSSTIDFKSELPWPIVIEDMEISGHMRIEMICNEHGLFLEIAEVIQKMNLSILKGVLEDDSSSAWARFVVEVPRGFHRMDVLCPLLHLMQLRRNSLT
ncbi:putative transcription factor bHLH family [Lupinus albus]|uniref:Putative transcription factor bHLH family n=1 Tax=Lupinus albus TaxID=3870 RepID=A0A6A4QXA3_LUPAL|nr:putative transcription factor bHLH family [Lupinus albus]